MDVSEAIDVILELKKDAERYRALRGALSRFPAELNVRRDAGGVNFAVIFNRDERSGAPFGNGHAPADAIDELADKWIDVRKSETAERITEPGQ